ncbi:hypothetical protein Droror1_Dr00027438 [Drosera rotundifolia]
MWKLSQFIFTSQDDEEQEEREESGLSWSGSVVSGSSASGSSVYGSRESGSVVVWVVSVLFVVVSQQQQMRIERCNLGDVRREEGKPELGKQKRKGEFKGERR